MALAMNKFMTLDPNILPLPQMKPNIISFILFLFSDLTL